MPPCEEADCYGLARLLTSAWCRELELPELLAMMAQRGGDLDGPQLQALLTETTGWSADRLMYQARYFQADQGDAAQLTQVH